jgi:pSer/pThr/pTyr-binding forkhead associated (FHA) protein
MHRFRLRLQDREIPLPETGEVVVGRDAGCDVPVDDRLVSRRHVIFRCEPGSIELVDLGSLNGVRVNEVPVTGSKKLIHRDRVLVGSHVFVLLDGQRDRRSNAPTTKATPMRGVSRASPRRRGGISPLDTISQALTQGDVAGAGRAMDAVVARYAESGEPVTGAELARVTKLLLTLAEASGDGRFFDRIVQIHTARTLVVEADVIDAILAALPRLAAVAPHAIDTYLEAMDARSAALSTSDQARLRRVSGVARKLGKAATP